MELASNPLDGELLAKKNSGAQEEGKEQFGDEVNRPHAV